MALVPRFARECDNSKRAELWEKLYGDAEKVELTELLYIIRDSASGDFNTFLTCFFAYITLAYFVGNKISNLQAIAISILYTGAVGLMAAGIISAGIRNYDLICIIRGNDTFYFGAVLVVGLSLTWLLSIVYMILVKTNHATIYHG